MTSPENLDLTEGMPRVDELFSRAVVAQLAEQRAQRETFAEVERKLESLERLVTERLNELSRQLGTDGQLEARIELLEQTLGTRLGGFERVVRAELDNRLGAMADRLHQVEQSLAGEDTGARLIALEATVKRRLGNLEEAVKLDELNDRLGRMERTLGELTDIDAVGADPALGSRLEAIERSVADRLGGLEELVPNGDVVRRLDTLESAVAESLGHLEEAVRSEEIGRRLKSLELALDERSGRIEEFVKTADLEHRIEALAAAVDEQLADLRSSLAGGGPVTLAGSDEGGSVSRALEETLSARLFGLEGSLRQLQEDTATRLDDLRSAGIASEAGILERIVAESQVVGAHFQAIRPVVEAAVASRPEIEEALAEVRRLADAAKDAGADLMSGVAGPPAPPTDGEPSGPYRVQSLEEAAASAAEEKDPGEDPNDSVFQPPEETPIPDRRFGILPRRDR